MVIRLNGVNPGRIVDSIGYKLGECIYRASRILHEVI